MQITLVMSLNFTKNYQVKDEPDINLTSEDVSSNKTDPVSRKSRNANRLQEADKRGTSANSEKGVAKNKDCRMTQESGPRRSKRSRLASKTGLNYADDSDDPVDSEGGDSESEEPITGRESAMPCRRNPIRAKRSNRYTSSAVKGAKERTTVSGMSERLSRESAASVDPKIREASTLDGPRKGAKSSNSQNAPVNDTALTLSSSAKRSHDAERTMPLLSLSFSCRAAAKSSLLAAVDRLALREVRSRSTAVTGGYHCVSCTSLRRSFSTFSRLAAHLVRSHGQLWACSACEKRFGSRHALHCHRRVGHGRPGLVGRRCAKSAVTAQSGAAASGSFSTAEHPPSRRARSRVSREDSASYNKCGWCGQKFECRSELLRHRDEVHRRPKEALEALTGKVRRKVMREWSCSEKGCNEHFKVKDKLREHMALEHPSVVFSCPECRFKTQVEHFLRR